MAKRGQRAVRQSWPDYRTVWRWHFYAGLFCSPFVVVLALSGSLYLFKPQVEAWIDRPYGPSHHHRASCQPCHPDPGCTHYCTRIDAACL